MIRVVVYVAFVILFLGVGCSEPPPEPPTPTASATASATPTPEAPGNLVRFQILPGANSDTSEETTLEFGPDAEFTAENAMHNKSISVFAEKGGEKIGITVFNADGKELTPGVYENATYQKLPGYGEEGRANLTTFLPKPSSRNASDKYHANFTVHELVQGEKHPESVAIDFELFKNGDLIWNGKVRHNSDVE